MSQKTSTSSRLPPWIERARQYIGVTEDPGPKNNTDVLNFFNSTDLRQQEPTLTLTDEIPWCAAFVTYCLSQTTTRILPPKSASVDAWSRYGETVTLNSQNLQPGDLVFWKAPRQHIGFVTKVQGNKVSVISGNSGIDGNPAPTGEGGVYEVTLPLSTFAMARRPGPGYPSDTGPQLTSNAAPPPRRLRLQHQYRCSGTLLLAVIWTQQILNKSHLQRSPHHHFLLS